MVHTGLTLFADCFENISPSYGKIHPGSQTMKQHVIVRVHGQWLHD